jgi:GTPase SAR1 family protein
MAKDQHRGDLVARLAAAAERLARPDERIVVVGEFKKGKSAFINALVGAKICPVDDHDATAVPIVIRYGAETCAVVVRDDPGDPARQLREAVDLSNLAAYALESGNGSQVRQIEVQCPEPLLKVGLVIVDTPGVGGLEASTTVATLSAVRGAHGVIFVSDASQEFTAPEMEFLVSVGQLCPNIVCVLTKTDVFHRHRDIVALNREHLKDRGLNYHIVAVSCALRERAWSTNDGKLNELSGFLDLNSQFLIPIIRNCNVIAAQMTASDIDFVLNQCASTLGASAAAIRDPGASQRLLAELKTAQDNAALLRGQSARWQIMMNDGITDLNAEVDFDLRRRVRQVTQEAEDAIDKSDPIKVWPEFSAWLERRTTHEVTANFSAMSTKVEELVTQVAELFAGDEAEITHDVQVVLPTIDASEATLPKNLIVPGLTHSSLSVVRGTWSSYQMFNSLGGSLKWHFLTGFNPFAMGLGMSSGAERYMKNASVNLNRTVRVRKQQRASTPTRCSSALGTTRVRRCATYSAS